MILTRCPNCGTLFRVTPEQLRVRHGQVRCGSCFATFNALLELTEEAPRSGALPSLTEPEPPLSTLVPESEEAPTVNETPVLPEDVPAPADESTAEDQAGDDIELIEIELPEAPEFEAPFEVPVEPAPEATTEPAIEPPIEPPDEPAIEIVEIEASSESQDEIGPMPDIAAGHDEAGGSRGEPEAVPGTAADEAPAPLAPEPLLHEETLSEPRQWPWWLGAGFALVALLAQAALHFRTDLAIRLPEARPALEAVCEQLGCDIPLPSKIDLLEIEHSDLTPDEKNTGHLLLSATLRNRAAHIQTWPHLELTLTDIRDRPLVRRALAPKDYLPAANVIAAGFPARGEQYLQLDLHATDVPAVGYRLYLFYP